MGPQNGFILLTLCHLAIVVGSFEFMLDAEQDTRLWKFHGRYFYTEFGEDLESLMVPEESLHLLQDGVLSEAGVRGLWFAKHVPNRDNQLTFSYSLTHQLLTQAWISYISHPSLPLLVKTNDGVLLNTFWSNGRSWCDAVVNVGLKTTISVEVTTRNSSDYFILDKIILGVFGNITHLNGRKLNPCSRVPVVLSTNSTEATTPKYSPIRQPHNNQNQVREESEQRQKGESSDSTESPNPNSNSVRKYRKSLRNVSEDSSNSTIRPSSTPKSNLDYELPPKDGTGRGLKTTSTRTSMDGNSDENMTCECSCSCTKRNYF